MRLSSIKLSGFKSFCEPISLDFPANRTVLVGPNGCGKSNIIDAIRWVLGESAASGLRSESMEDVIFNGTENNPPRGRAMVEMVFENNKNRLEGKYHGTKQIRIKRTLERDSDSRYYINNSPCRKKDIAEIFAGMGLTGKSDYAIVTQGAVHNIVESRPEYIRAMIEEAADITGYLNKRKETFSHIRSTRENLKGINLNITEIKGRVRTLEKQADSAKAHKENKNQLAELKEQLALSTYRQLMGQKNQSRRRLNELVQKMNEDKNSAGILQLNKQQLAIAVEEERIRLNKELEKQKTLSSKITDIEARQRYESKSLAEKEASLAADEDELKKIASRIVQEQEQLDAAQDELSHQKELKDKTSPTINNDLSSAEEELEQLNQQWRQAMNQAGETRAKHQDVKNRLSSLQEEERRILTTQQKQEQERTEDGTDIVKLKKEYELLNAKIKQLEAQEMKATNEREDARKNSTQINQKYRLVEDSYLKHSTMIEELSKEPSDEKLPNSIKSLLNKIKINPATAWGDKIQITAGWEKALDLVAGQMLQARLTKNLNSALGLLKDTKDVQLELIGDYKNDDSSKEQKFGDKKSLSSMVKAEHIPSFLDHVFACDDLPQAINLRDKLSSHQSLATKNGDWVGKNWAIIQSGTTNNKEYKYSLARKKRLELLNGELNVLSGSKRELAASLSECEKNIKQSNEQIERTHKQIVGLRQNMQQQKEVIIRKQEVTSLWEKRKDEVNKQRHDNKARLKQLKIEISATENEELKSLGEKQKQDEALQIAEKKRAELTALLSSLKSTQRKEGEERNANQVRREELLSLIARLESSIAGAKVRRGTLNNEKEKLLSEIFNLRNALKQHDAELSKLTTEDKDLGAIISKMENQIAEQEKEIRSIDNKMNKAEKDIALAEKDLQQSRGIEQQLELELNEISRRTKVLEGKESIEAMKKMDDLAKVTAYADPKAINSQIKIIERENYRIGDVNMLALAEYQEQKERLDKLLEQQEQINKALDNLHKAIKRIDRESRVKFDKTFKQINKVFSELFNRLTNGGKAKLEEEDTESHGIRIMVRPPGRRNTMLSLLSGGEKSVTAIAFIMAIFHLNPAPFCLMDEADAMLDDNNIKRFNQMLNSMADDIQFILITHSKLSMQEAKHIIGVTMSEPGISRIVSVDMDRALELSRQASA